MANADTYGYDWSKFQGGAEALKWNRRDLRCLDRIIARVPERCVAVQAGGNLGVYPKHLARSFETVLTFEPAQDLFTMMTANAPEPNILRYQAALGYERSFVGMSRVRRDGKSNHHEGVTHVSGPGVIPTLRLDDFSLPVCNLLCLDVEGYELFALQGAVETLARCRPIVAVEINKNAAFVGLTEEEIRAFVLAQGYRFVERLESDEVFVPQEWTS